MHVVYNKKFWSSFVAAFFVIVFAVIFLIERQRESLAQNRPRVAETQQIISAPENKIVSTVSVRPVTAELVRAAGQNTVLKNNCVWAFGGKSQRGWRIYESLINELIANNSAADNDFAAALARWQQTSGIEANGVLDEIALQQMVKTWQSNRLKVRGYPTPDQLLTAPASDFWDASRVEELRQVERNTFAAYKRMVAAAAADKSLRLALNPDNTLAASEKYLKIISAFRSREYQARLRAASPNSGRAGLATNSPHFTGRALDIYVGGEPVETKDHNRMIQVNTPVYKWLVKNAGKFGFKPYFYEPWHWEYAPDEEAGETPAR